MGDVFRVAGLRGALEVGIAAAAFLAGGLAVATFLASTALAEAFVFIGLDDGIAVLAAAFSAGALLAGALPIEALVVIAGGDLGAEALVAGAFAMLAAEAVFACLAVSVLAVGVLTVADFEDTFEAALAVIWGFTAAFAGGLAFAGSAFAMDGLALAAAGFSILLVEADFVVGALTGGFVVVLLVVAFTMVVPLATKAGIVLPHADNEA